ncbi:DUF4175 family protein [uncultured Paracoccus sp.]|uniref:DUF4175 domain-containing protein n=1 Tax=uncultured Paracoccus sp. TaxID=189685 RepID=UPI00260E855C|nr:DUF4175 family protein [uncultured Paracoccus sp.]
MRRAVRLTLVGLWWEAALRAFWPALTLLIIGLAAMLLGAVAALPPRGALAVSGLWTAALVAAVAAGLSRFARPRMAQARARVDAGLPGAPLAALRDRMALGANDPGARALWRAHLARMRASAAAARPVRPDAGLRRRDPLALRLVALIALAMALLFGGAAQMGQGLAVLASTWKPARDGQGEATATGPGWEGWATPPAYTRRPTIYLNALRDGEELAVPEGTMLSFRLYGGGTDLTQDVGPAVPDTPPEAPAFTAERDGVVTVAGLRLPFRVLPDAAPTAGIGPIPERRADGQMVQDFSAADDNGVEQGQALVTLDLNAVDRRYGLSAAPEPREALALDLPLPAAGQRRDVRGRLSADLSRHPWANLPVQVVVRVTDGIGQAGGSAPVRMELPGRRFFDPTAAALIELRRDLLWSRDNRARTARLLRAVRWQPDTLPPDLSPELQVTLAQAIDSLETDALSEPVRDEVAEMLWVAAVQLEDGGLADALERMQRAQERLSEAIRNGASPDEIQKLMDELRAATDAYTQMLAERGEDPANRFDRSPEQGQQITGDQIQEMLDEIQRLMDEGRMAEAQALLEQFNRMMENLKVTQSQGGEGGQGGQSRPMQRLNDTLREQQRLADEAMRQAQDDPFGTEGQPQDGQQPGEGQQPGQQQGQGQSGQGQPGAGQSPEGGQQDGGSLADRQRALREELGRQRGLLPGRGTDPGEAAGQRLDEAGRAMEEAEQALRDGDPAGAIDRQADAIEAMREGMRALADLQRGQEQGSEGAPQEGQGQSPGQSGQSQPRGGDGFGQFAPPSTDPLGRDLSGQGGMITTGDPLADGVDPDQRARELQDEIRRRSAERERPRSERDYLGRLLDRF